MQPKKREKTIETFLREIGIEEFIKTNDIVLKELIDKRFSEGFHYGKFNNARLSEDLQEWLKKEKRYFRSWQIFFEELKKRYEKYESEI